MGGVATNTIKDFTEFLTGFVLTLTAELIAFFAFLLEKFISLQDGIFNVKVVQVGWSIIKNFVNLIFVLILVVIAFATIFDKAKYAAKSLLVRVIIIALLVNFSLLVGQTVISVADFLSTTFLREIQRTNQIENALTVSIMQGFGLQKEHTTDGSNFLVATQGAATKLTTTLVFSIILFIVVLFAFMVMALFIIVRIPILWFLLMVSPLAWFAYILPNTQKYWGEWWKEFIGWAFFTPVYLFILMFGIGFIKAKTQIDLLIPGGNETILDQLGYSDIFFYIITLIFVGGGLFAAKKVSFIAGTGAVSWAGKIEGGVKSMSGYKTFRQGAQKGLTAKGEQIKEKGIMGIGGAQKARLREAGVAQFFAGGALPGQANKARLDEAKKEEGNLKKYTDSMSTKQAEAFLKQKQQSGSSTEKLAAMRILNAKKLLSPQEQIQLYTLHGGDSSEAARQFAKKDMSYDTWDKETRQGFFNQVNDAEVKRQILDAQARLGDLKGSLAETLKSLAGFFTTQKAQIAFLATTASKDGDRGVKESAKAIIELGLRDTSGQLMSTEDAIQIINKKKDDIKEQAKREALAKAINRDYESTSGLDDEDKKRDKSGDKDSKEAGKSKS